MPKRLFIDFETRSAVDLKTAGVHKYAEDPSTDILCTGWAFDSDEPMFSMGGTLSPWVKDHVHSGGIVVAHNVQFELAVWNLCAVPKYGWPELKVEQCDCTMVRAYAMALPGSLDNAAAAVGIDTRKDMAGHRLMLKLSRPRGYELDGSPIWWHDKADLESLFKYCLQDIAVTQKLDKKLLQLSIHEKRVWVLDQKINNRGVLVDIPAVEAASILVVEEQQRLNTAMREVTSNQVATFNAHTQLKTWLLDQGIQTKGVGKNDIRKMLSRSDISPVVRNALEVRQEAAKSSNAKLKAFTSRACLDQSVKGIFQHWGATTGRWAGRGIQPQNFPRPNLTHESVEDCFNAFAKPDAMSYLGLMHGNALGVISDCLRGFLIARPGKVFLAADFSAIEARVVAWLSGEDSVLDIFRRGEDIYAHAAASIYGVSLEDVTKSQRQIGKVAVLALGYQGGVGAFQAMAEVYGVSLAPVAVDLWKRAPKRRKDQALWGWKQRGIKSGLDKKEWMGAELTKLAWREANPKIVKFWADVESAAIDAVQAEPAKDTDFITTAGPCFFKKSGSFLFCRLPSGRCLTYPYPSIKATETPWGETKELLRFKTEVNREWKEQGAYGGYLVENITQAVARDLLAEAMLRCDKRQLDIVLHVHDEIVVEIDGPIPKHFVGDFEKLVSITPEWAKGLPIKAEGWSGRRYRK